MEVVYCNNCGLKIASDAFSAGTAVRGDDGKIYCGKCDSEGQMTVVGAPAVKASALEQGVMKFYFCETCGKRITDKQILEGLGRDKKLKGIFCKDCAVGVMTMEFAAISDADLRKPIRNAVPLSKESPAESKPVQNASRAGIPPAKRSESRLLKPAVHANATSKTGAIPVVSAIAVAGILGVLGTLVLTSGSPPKNVLTENRSAARPNEDVKPQPIQSPVMHEARKERAIPSALPVEIKTETLPEGPKSDPETLAQTARTLRDGIAAVGPSNKPHAPVTDLPVHDPKQMAAEPLPAKTADSAAVTQKLLQQSLTLLSQMDIPAALRSVEQDRECSDDARNALKAALQALQKREATWREALAKNVGHKVTLKTRTGVVNGIVLSVESAALKIDKPLIIDGSVMGSATTVVAFADILPGSRDALAPESAPATIDEWMVQALASMADQDFDAADAALAHCDGHALQPALKSLESTRTANEKEAGARKAWGEVTGLYNAKRWKEAKTGLESFCEKYGTSQCARDAKKDMEAMQDSVASKLLLGNTPEQGLKLWLRFDDGKGSIATNSVVKGLDATLKGATWGKGKLGGALAFNGAQQYAVSGDLLGQVGHESVSISLWFNAAAAGVIVQELGDLTWHPASHYSQIEILAGGDVKMRVWRLAPVSFRNVKFNEWHHVVLVYDHAARTLNGYLDGVKAATEVKGTRSAPPPAGLFYGFGAADEANMGSGAYFTGLIDEVRIYNRPLTAIEVKALTNSGNEPQK